MKKILFVSNTANFSKFNKPLINWFKKQGWNVDYASNGDEKITECINDYKIDIQRSPFSFKNIKAYFQLKKIVVDNDYDIIHCHTPMGGVLARIAAKRLRAKVIYTAHGFHFYKGASILNWLVYYPIEKYLSRITDVLVTIVDEDFRLAKKKFSKCKNIFLIDGVGVNLSRFIPLSDDAINQIRLRNGFQCQDFIISIVAEINKNKNQIFLIKQLDTIIHVIPNVRIVLIGKESDEYVKKYVGRHKLEKYVHFLGYRNDVNLLIGMSDIAFSSSIREGLPINIIESMACQVPILCSKNRGHNALIRTSENGFLFDLKKPKEMISLLQTLYTNKEIAQKVRLAAGADSHKYNVDTSLSKMADIYRLIM